MSFGENLVVRTKLLIPRLKPRVLVRPRLNQLLAQALHYPLTLVKAEAGYGKTTALAAFVADAQVPTFWYSLSDTDAEPLLFLLHLIHLFRQVHPHVGEDGLRLLAGPGGVSQHWAAVIDGLVNDLLDALDTEALLVLDDYHTVDCPELNRVVTRLIERMPPRLHLLIAARATPHLPALVDWRVHDEVLEIGQRELAFRADEVLALFTQQFHIPLTRDQAEGLTAEVEGWIIALRMIAQDFPRHGFPRSAMAEQSIRNPQSAIRNETLGNPQSTLFDFLATEVLNKQPPFIQTFMLQTSVLRRLDPEVCDGLVGRDDSAALLSQLEDDSLFVVSMGGGMYRYHHLFHDFLARCAQTDAGAWRTLHRRAAELYQARGADEESVYHWLAAEEYEAAAELLNRIGGAMVVAGRWETLAQWIDRLLAARVNACSDLLFYRGEANRLSSNFDAALDFYQRARMRARQDADCAAEWRALCGQAAVFLDTVQPARAKPILAEAWQLAQSPAHKVTVLTLIAENLTNAGELRRAERLLHTLRQRCPDFDGGDVEQRLLTRQGRLAQARTLVERELSAASSSRHQPRVPRSHRESAVLLAWLCAMLGDEQAARSYAERGVQLGRELHSPIVEAVAQARVGHAYLTGADYDTTHARQAYHESLRQSEVIRVPRFGAEAHLGLTVAYGLEQQMHASYEHARTGLAILEEAGDHYLTAVQWLALGSAAVLCQDERAVEWLRHSAALAKSCGDAYGYCLAQLWEALWQLEKRAWAEFDHAAAEALRRAREQGYDFVLTRQPFLGPKEPYGIAALLTAANRRGIEAAYTVQRLQELAARLPQLAPSMTPWPWLTPPLDRGSEEHSATPLVVRTFGTMRIWRGAHEIPKAAWGREKALQLFQLLLTRRRAPLHREQIMELLWHDAKSSSAATSLRVALNALRQTLEPERALDSESGLILRQGEFLQLNPEANVQIDADEFERLIQEARQSEARDPARALTLYRRALALYQGDYLQDALYEDWASKERERLLDLYLTTAGHVAERLTAQGEYDGAIQLCRQILAKDACWEEAYYLLMQCYMQQGNRSLALRTYERCVKRLRAELAVAPAARTTALYEAISRT